MDSIPFSLLTRAFRLSYDEDGGWGSLRIQSIVMSLVAQVFFPPLSTIVASPSLLGLRRRQSGGCRVVVAQAQRLASRPVSTV